MTSSHLIAKTPTRKPRVLVVEDQSIIASMIASELRDLGFEVVGPAFTNDAAEDLVRRDCLSAAVLDFRLDHTTTEDLARTLKQRGCPVLFVSAHGINQAPADLRECEWLQKPFSHEELALAIRQLVPADVQCKQGDCQCRL